MRTPPLATISRRISTWKSRLAKPLSNWWCATGWLIATLIFVGLTTSLGGPTEGDAGVSIYAAWAIAHGSIACAFPAAGTPGSLVAAPLYPLLSGGFAALLRIGDRVPFPTQIQLGPGCSKAVTTMIHWSLRSSALRPTLDIGYVGWMVLVAGTVFFLRASGRGRSGWESVALAVMACTPPVFMCLNQYFHPQDLIAMGLSLGAMASARKGRWFWAGALIGLAAISQQFALLIFAPLLVAAPRNQWVRFVGAAVGSVAIIVIPLASVTSLRALTAALVGTGASSKTETLLDLAPIHGSLLFTVSRLSPVALALVLTWWTGQRLSGTLLMPVPLVSTVCLSLCLRLVFEVNLFGYYFMAVSVLLLLLDVVRARVRPSLVAWIALVTAASMKGGLSNNPTHSTFPIWLLQIVLVTSATALAAGPLIRLMSSRNRAGEELPV
jgi:hypothetical protein